MIRQQSTVSTTTTDPIQIPPQVATVPFTPEFTRLPKPGQLCPYFGLSRSAINQLILACDQNGHKPPVRSFCLRQRGAKTGIRLVDYKSMRQFILDAEELHGSNGAAGQVVA